MQRVGEEVGSAWCQAFGVYPRELQPEHPVAPAWAVPPAAGEDHVRDLIDVSGSPAVDVHRGSFSTVTLVIVMLTAVIPSKMFIAELQLGGSQAI